MFIIELRAPETYTSEKGPHKRRLTYDLEMMWTNGKMNKKYIWKVNRHRLNEMFS